LEKVQELESNNSRAQFANRYYGLKNENSNLGNNLQFNPANSKQNKKERKGMMNNWNYSTNQTREQTQA